MNTPNTVMPANSPASDDAEIVVLSAVAVSRGPIGDIAVDSSGRVVVTNFGDNSVSVINPDTLTVEDTLTVDGEPFAVAVTEDRAYVSTTSTSYDAVPVIDTDAREALASYPLAFSVTALALSPDGKRVFAGRSGWEHVDIAVIDVTSDRVGTIDLARGAGISVDAVRVSPSGKRVYAATSDVSAGRLLVVDAETACVIDTVTIGSPIRDLALRPDGNTAYVLSCDSVHGGTVDVVDLETGKITASAGIGGSPTQMTLDADGARAYIVDHDHLAVFCTETGEVVDRMAVGAGPSCVAADLDRLYVADHSGVVTVLSVAHETATDVLPLREVRELESA